VSPHVEQCCLLLSANEAYEHAAEDIAVLTGIAVSKSTQQRLVHRQEFPDEQVDGGVKEMSLDGGKVRLRTPQANRVSARLQGCKPSPVLRCRILQGQ
jgi:hypothetical protein